MSKAEQKKSFNQKTVGSVAELFAGVGGFRIGLEKVGWKIVFSNQWEPATKKQHASSVYVTNFGTEGHVCEDIAKIKKIPAKFDLLVGGFPCQDYSVAKTLNKAKGLRGKKGVLWWEILRLVTLHKPKYLFLENVDRLLKSPSTQRGRDFAVMLRTLADLGYQVEWRVVNAAEYGFPQRRIRVFIVASRVKKVNGNPFEIISKTGVLARALPVIPEQIICNEVVLNKDIQNVSKNFNRKSGKSPFQNSGVMIGDIAYSIQTAPNAKIKYFQTLGDVLEPESKIDDSFYVAQKQIQEWKYLKGAKSIERIHKESGISYTYDEGSMAFPDSLTRPSRTILTGEGGSTPSRFKHIIKTKKGFRRLTPTELERLNGFPDNWTKFDNEEKEVSETKRAFFMGNALVIGLIEKVGKVLAEEMSK